MKGKTFLWSMRKAMPIPNAAATEREFLRGRVASQALKLDCLKDLKRSVLLYIHCWEREDWIHAFPPSCLSAH